MPSAWRWASARSVGTSHAKSGLPCQDYLACIELGTGGGSVLAAVVSDGAGSASHAEVGARMVCFGFLRAAQEHFRCGKALEDIDRNVALHWLGDIQERLKAFAMRAQIRPRDCAATLVGVLIGPQSAVVIHVGDGAAVLREQGASDWTVPSWPFHGEYASTTSFLTDDPMPKPFIAALPFRLDYLAVFSDGIERLVLDYAKRTPHSPFFDRIIAPVATSVATGRDRGLSKHLHDYLDAKVVCDHTDDDKSLILAVRQ